MDRQPASQVSCARDFHLIEINEAIEPDPHVDRLVQDALRPYRDELDQLVGETKVPLDRGFNLESTMDNFLLSALREHTQAEIVFSNGWRYGAPVIPGPVHLNDLYNMVPINPPASTVELTGKN